ncbi:msl8708 [Mesorhizobium japonicum MAFF 303099]|uniref:Msl8708 protein n=1 Tax=Mesorhizobium japonicum (strain LMG 29417 / CECT 9101 / MAFF 303099) TaxID=266835 RepID=Q987P1_RHILO|nr:msl8708 [Mesorhizobium japonicum MAFF 303099]
MLAFRIDGFRKWLELGGAVAADSTNHNSARDKFWNQSQ